LRAKSRLSTPVMPRPMLDLTHKRSSSRCFYVRPPSPSFPTPCRLLIGSFTLGVRHFSSSRHSCKCCTARFSHSPMTHADDKPSPTRFGLFMHVLSPAMFNERFGPLYLLLHAPRKRSYSPIALRTYLASGLSNLSRTEVLLIDSYSTPASVLFFVFWRRWSVTAGGEGLCAMAALQLKDFGQTDTNLIATAKPGWRRPGSSCGIYAFGARDRAGCAQLSANTPFMRILRDSCAGDGWR